MMYLLPFQTNRTPRTPLRLSVLNIIVHRQSTTNIARDILISVDCPTPRQSILRLHVRHVKKVFRADTFAGSFPNRQARPSVGEKLKSSQDGLIHRHYD
ncbi:hypothetical protein BDQ94DRAFT_132382 [Aspergillus welwitschiae]|uniref:Uncharacterized protein n=1 Tax=Aspergillus welwitschiae TaxID=1341132 RepID=A0A3F3QJ22_9EURO|nr:hypothetical protein BDQ94DRAFT_132382 [Aspergillus welwitschiae]RDH39105.1 hypothetical protein BDQ94DRAFT_132382 [Aspergillus welwitschiae]